MWPLGRGRVALRYELANFHKGGKGSFDILAVVAILAIYHFISTYFGRSVALLCTGCHVSVGGRSSGRSRRLNLAWFEDIVRKVRTAKSQINQHNPDWNGNINLLFHMLDA